MSERDASTYGSHRVKFQAGFPRRPTGLIIAAWISTLASYLPSYFISFFAYFCALGCGIALVRHKNKSKITQISGWVITVLFAIRFIVLILIILRSLNVIQF